MHINENDLGSIIKTARKQAGFTQEELAEKVGVGHRHIMGIENEGSKPSYDLLYKLIRELHIPSDSIFYPEKLQENSQIDEIIGMLYQCDDKSINMIQAALRVAIYN